MKIEIKKKDKIINEYAKIINGTKKEYQKLYGENIKYRENLKQQQEHDRRKYNWQMRDKEMYEKQKQRKRDRQYIRRPKNQRWKNIATTWKAR